jgi:hypothetical protein
MEWSEVVMAHFKVLSQNLLEETVEDHGRPVSIRVACWDLNPGLLEYEATVKFSDGVSTESRR